VMGDGSFDDPTGLTIPDPFQPKLSFASSAFLCALCVNALIAGPQTGWCHSASG